MQEFENIVAVAQIIFVPLDIALVAAFVFVLVRALEFRPRLGITAPRRTVVTIQKAEIVAQWTSIQEKIAAGTPDMAKLAVIDADKLIDSILKRAGIEGEHMADRLDRISPEEYPSVQSVWRAHRLRNELVHSQDFQVRSEDAARAIEGYAAFLREVGLI